MDLKYYKSHYCSDIENVENFEKAKADNFKGWSCHHRLETHNSDGERRLVDITQAELIALGMYYNRPASELIFMKHSEHSSLHKPSEETRNKIGAAHKGKQGYWKGKNLSEEVKKKISEANKGKQKSEEVKKKISEAKKGKCTGENSSMYGRRHSAESIQKMSDAKKGKKLSEETRKKMSESRKGKLKTEEWKKKLSEAHKGNTCVKGKRWYNNGEICTRSFECPPGFIPGRLKRK